jgi:hypothetical protein
MPYSLIWLPEILKNAGLKVAPVDGWEDRGRGDMGNILGIICHHTATPEKGNMPTLHTLIHGRSDLPGPLAQLGLGRDGTFYIVAAGRCNHAGKGVWQGLVNGNTNFIGIEAENTGGSADYPWPKVQMDAYQRGVAAILKHSGRSHDFCAGHKEYARPLHRKNDPSFDMVSFRDEVASIMNGQAPAPQLIPSVEPNVQPGVAVARPTLRRGSKGEFVKQAQTKLGITADGDFGPNMEAAVRSFQREQGLVPDGIIGPRSWMLLDKKN